MLLPLYVNGEAHAITRQTPVLTPFDNHRLLLVPRRLNPNTTTSTTMHHHHRQQQGAQLPFGSCRLGPDTARRGPAGHDDPMPAFDHYGGYHFGDNSVVAFSHTHLVGAGVG